MIKDIIYIAFILELLINKTVVTHTHTQTILQHSLKKCNIKQYAHNIGL
jgi:hypothetical protein